MCESYRKQSMRCCTYEPSPRRNPLRVAIAVANVQAKKAGPFLTLLSRGPGPPSRMPCNRQPAGSILREGLIAFGRAAIKPCRTKAMS